MIHQKGENTKTNWKGRGCQSKVYNTTGNNNKTVDSRAHTTKQTQQHCAPIFIGNTGVQNTASFTYFHSLTNSIYTIDSRNHTLARNQVLLSPTGPENSTRNGQYTNCQNKEHPIS